MKCRIPKCKKKYYAKGYCKTHYTHNWLYGHPLLYKKNRPIEERFWEKVEKRHKNECWLWRDKPHGFGYGRFGIWNGHKGQMVLAHRMSYELARGTIKAGQFVLHRCDNPQCVNPHHLYLGTQADNMRDMYSKGRYGKRTKDFPITCGHADRPYHARMMCEACYHKQYYQTHKEKWL